MFRPHRPAVVHGALVLFACALVAKAAQVQLFERDRWRSSAERQQVADATLPAPRGAVTDAEGEVLVESRELVQLRVAPGEVRDRGRLRALLTRAGVPAPWPARAVDTNRRWVELPGQWLPTDVAAVTATRGVHAAAVMQRVASASAPVQRIVGRVGADGEPVDGVELALDTVLRGTGGTRQLLRDARGGRLESPGVRSVAARPGNTVALTINKALQEICERALADAVARMGATGGDIVVLDPHLGEVRALASQRADPRTTAATALAEPFEPGSTVKPFVAAALLARGRARPDEAVNTENGEWTVFDRTIRDVHRAPSMTLRDVIRHSSNVGIVKFAQRLTPREQYEALRDLGFGTPTGVPYPAEAAGTLRPPARWTKQSPASLAMGYEMAATPLQLAAAYAAVANGGELLEPALVREVRDPEGRVRYRHARRVVRRVMPEAVAAEVRAMLKSVVDSGTATGADLASYEVGGKSGTVRRIERGRGYAAGRYNAVFAGIFPVEQPQFVVVVKLDNPAGVYYGGKIAAPVTKVVLEAALAARDAALDRGALAGAVRPKARAAWAPHDSAPHGPAPGDSAPNVRAAGPAVSDSASGAAAVPPPPLPAALRRPAVDTTAPASEAPQLVDLAAARRPAAAPARPDARAGRAAAGAPTSVPAVQGLPLRDAVFALQRAGFRVRVADAPAAAAAGGDARLVARPAGRTVPPAGASAAAGAAVTLYRAP